MSTVFIAFQANEDTRPIIEAIAEDNPHARLNEAPAMVKIDAEGRLTVRRSSIEERLGRDFDLQELHVNLISLSGHIDETDDEFTLSWNA
ncbi:monooxygenase [Pseudothauera nasutitermitis]|uniref:Monooxygenase n=1 Tax=Pseudothauera nasutitermitis TaxID=2565930 RepID=A0A4S4AQ76_9RHOO|nr:MmoB/DmpM family protein [Pseudothauera nasutitermitis]THF61860.1 monooxygenase [Pseudothauera nasutitermitis]